MSFCFDTKQEICSRIEKRKSAMLYGMILFADKIGDRKIQITSENVFVINLLDDVLSELFGFHFTVSETATAYTAVLEGEALQTVYTEYHMDPSSVQLHFDADLLPTQKDVFAFIRGAFLVSGFITNPYSGYHAELVTHYYHMSGEVKRFLNENGLPFRSVVRKSHYVLYLKDSTYVEQLLYVLGANQAAFTLINAKIYKQRQNDENRLNNCDGYNRDKTMDRAIEQILAINTLQKNGKFEHLPEDLREAAQLRLAHKSASLSELSRLSGAKYSKAGLSRKLGKIVELSEKDND